MSLKDTIRLIFKGEDKISEATESAGQSLEDLARQSNETATELKKLKAQEKLIEKFKALKGALGASELAMEQTATALNKLEAQARQTDTPTKELAEAIERAKVEASAAEKAYKSNVNGLAKLSAQVTATGADVKKLDQAEGQLKAETAALTAKQNKLKSTLSQAGLEARNQQRETKSLGASYSELAGKATLVGAALAGAFVGLKSFLTGAGNSEYANKKLADTLTRTTNATREQIAATQAQAEALQKVTRFTDEEIKAGQTKLAEQKLTAAQVQQLTPLLLDMAEAKRESGEADADTIGSAEAIGDAMRNSIAALESFGVHITEATEEQYKNATMGERQALVMEALKSTFEGAAVAAGDTWAGAVDKSANKTQEAMETLASFITENETIKKLVGDVGQAFSDMAASIASEAPAINFFVSAIGTALRGVFDTARLLGNGLQGVWISLQVAMLELEATLVGVWARVNDALGRDDAAEAARNLASVIDQQLNQAYKDLDQNGKDVKETVKSLGQNLVEFGNDAGGVSTATKQAADDVKALGSETEALAEKTTASGAEMREVFAGLGLSYDKLATGLDGATQKSINSFSKIIKEVTKTHAEAEDLNRILGPALQKTLESIDTPEAFKALEEQISKAAEESEGLAGVILGTLTPAIDKHAEHLQAQGVYVDDANGRYARMAEILGLEMVDGFYKSTKAAEENAKALETAAEKAKTSGKTTRDSINEAAEVASAKGGGIAAFFNAASSLVAELGEKATAQFNQAMSIDAPTGVEYFQQKAETAFNSIQRSMDNITTNGLQKFLKKTSMAARQVEADFYTQRASVEQLSQAIGATAYPTEGLIKRAESAMNTFDLLDDATLSGLRSQIESARAAITSLEDSAAQTLDSISQQLANAKGEYSIAVKNQYDAQLAELEAKLKQARAFGNDQAISDLNDAMRKLEELQRIEIAAAKEREQAEKQNTSNREKSEFTIKIGDTNVSGEASEDELDKLKRFSSST